MIDKWIINRLSELVKSTNVCFEKYDFGPMVHNIYDFWLKELADYYIEAIKPVMKGNDEEAKKAALNTLYLCLDHGLKLLHPTMPYITEELYQRLPHRKGEAFESICIATFPLELKSFDNQKVNEGFNDLKEMVLRFRSLIAALNIKKDQNPNIFIKCSSDATFAQFSPLGEVMRTLIKCGEASFLKGSDKDPEGCLQVYINDELKIFLKVVGVIEVKSAYEQLQNSAGTIQKRLTDAIGKTKKPNYKEKVPAAVQEEDAKKIKQFETELAEAQGSIDGLKKLL